MMPNTPSISCPIHRRLRLLLLRLQLLLDLATSLDALQDALTVLVELELGDNNVRGSDAEGNGLA